MWIIANWKMHGDPARVNAWLGRVAPALEARPEDVHGVFCPPAIWLEGAYRTLGDHPRLALGGQDCRAEAEGAFTGDISARMLKKAGARYTIVGHSERRTLYGETSEMVAQKCRAVKHAGMLPIVCVGETLEEREAGRTLDVVREQLQHSIAGGDAYCIVAYEPVWAIGTGRTPSPAEIAQVHGEISDIATAMQQSRDRRIPVVYGGSVNPANAASILALPEVSGALIGSASLEADSFLAIVERAAKAKGLEWQCDASTVQP